MTSLLYLISLLVSAAGMALVDRRFRLVLWCAPRRAVLVLALSAGFFLLWDLAAISAGHYMAGRSEAMTGIMLAPELPLEELVFVTFLSYTTLVLRGLAEEVLRRRCPGRADIRRRGSDAAPPAAPLADRHGRRPMDPETGP
ncbi:lycopene cyclase domain-containing protein [Brachybacterium sp. YJGR34]|uniref:lycopene cyclase domain-containing protein n=1 Tax=Brachybacterium sp. YJGR34 TaxID=2059911 RepID=UPI000E0AB8FA|nr:lycopene cyclase domain-containing protein [Brachybacterium sp. YJGR34]